MTTSIPTISQIYHVRQLVVCGLFGTATIAHLTGVPLRDVFQITRLPDWVKVAPDGTILAGQHRLFAMLQTDAR